MRRALSFALLLWASPLAAQRFAMDLLGDVEVWKTDGGSRILARDSGDGVVLGRLHGWLVVPLPNRIEFRALGVATVATEDLPEYGSLEQLELRWRPTPSFGLEAGRLLMPVGAFGQRHFSDANPLVGDPDLYPPVYPWGAVVGGVVGWFDYRVGAVSLPIVNPRYAPRPGHRLRPAVSAGLTLSPALRVGVGATYGPYLGRGVEFALPAGSRWQDFPQAVIAGDLRWSFAYFDTRAEAVWSSYEVPTHGDKKTGFGAYIETKVTLAPRWFIAARIESNDYAFIMPINQFFWAGARTLQRNAEIGIGYRPMAGGLVKLSYRRDQWPGVVGPAEPPAPNGYALALQGSLRVDVVGLFARY